MGDVALLHRIARARGYSESDLARRTACRNLGHGGRRSGIVDRVLNAWASFSLAVADMVFRCTVTTIVDCRELVQTGASRQIATIIDGNLHGVDPRFTDIFERRCNATLTRSLPSLSSNLTLHPHPEGGHFPPHLDHTHACGNPTRTASRPRQILFVLDRDEEAAWRGI